MKTWKFGRTALVIALAMAIILSVTGGTIAWFTDEVTSAQNVIQAGNLDMVVEYATSLEDATAGKWKTLDANTKLFKEGALYEPGYTEVVYLRVANEGNLAFKYKVGLTYEDNVTSTNVYGEKFKLSDSLKIGSYRIDEFADQNHPYWEIMKDFLFGNRTLALSTVGTLNALANGEVDLVEHGPVLAGEKTSQIVVLVLNMPTTVGNKANHAADALAPQVTFGVNVVATQFTDEKDSFGNDYDANAEYPVASAPNDYPQAIVTAENGVEMNFLTVDITPGGIELGQEEDITLETKLTFTANETAESLAASPYRWWNGDFTVSVNKPVPANVIGLAGEYGDYAIAFDVNDGLCDMIEAGSTEIPANTEFRLLAPFDYYVNYDEIVNDVKKFICGVYFTDDATEEQKQALKGTTITVTLNLYETIDPSENNGEPSETEVVPEKSIWIGTYDYTF